MSRIHNFSAGPAVLPEPVLNEAREALIEFGGTGLGIMEMSHRSAAYDAVIVSARERLARLLGVTDTHTVLFLGGGASSQFFQVPMNLLRGGRAAYMNTGRWSNNAIVEAQRFGTVDVVYSSRDAGYDHVPAPGRWDPVADDTVYFHYTSNNTVAGTQFSYQPEVDVPVVVDMSSDILARPANGPTPALIYAGAQKNLGPAGVTVVVIRNDLLERCDPDLPTILRYPTQAAKASMFNTPPTFPIYVVERVCNWIEAQGGLAAVGARNEAQAAKLYATIDRSDFWRGLVRPDSRSIMTPTFTTGDADTDTRFWKAAADAGMSGLKGHRSVGGLRASMYNACPDAAVDALVDFMRDFEARNG